MTKLIGELLISAPTGVDLDAVLARMKAVKAGGHAQRCVFVGHPAKWQQMIAAADAHSPWLHPEAFVSTRAQADLLTSAGIGFFQVQWPLDIEPAELPTSRADPLGFVAEEWMAPIAMAPLDESGLLLGPANARMARWLATARDVRVATDSVELAGVLADRSAVQPRIRLVALTPGELGKARVLAAAGEVDVVVRVGRTGKG